MNHQCDSCTKQQWMFLNHDAHFNLVLILAVDPYMNFVHSSMKQFNAAVNI